MANTIDVAFIKQFESEVHMAYQRMGSKLRNTVRTVGNVVVALFAFRKSVLALLLPRLATAMSLVWNWLTRKSRQPWQTSMLPSSSTSWMS